jgi:hypothetical protein
MFRLKTAVRIDVVYFHSKRNVGAAKKHIATTK